LPIPGKGNSDWSYAWIPVFGPLLGGVIGGLSYLALYENIYSPLLYVALLLLFVIFALGYYFKDK
jgi:glycerol uptake facilitator protein